MDIPDLISSLDNVQRINDMQVQPEAYYNFVNSIDSEAMKKIYDYCMSRFLKCYDIDLDSLLKLPQQEILNLIIKYLVDKKIQTIQEHYSCHNKTRL